MADASTLCRRCGLCCDGNLFASVPLAAEEVAPLRAQGLVIVGQALRQRCAGLGEAGCGVYAQRPGRCREYRCMLLIALGDGEVDLDAALAVVDEAHARLAAVGPGPGSALARARRGEGPEARAVVGFVARHFERSVGA